MNFGKSRIFLLLCLSFVAGIGLGRFVNYHVMAVLAMIFVMFVTLGWAKKLWMTIGFLGLAFLAGTLRLNLDFSHHTGPNFLGNFYDQELVMTGIVVKDPDVRETRTNLTIAPEGYEGRVLLTVGRYPEYRYGDKLQISGLLEEPFESEEFSYKNYLSRFDTYALMRFPEITKLAEDQGHPVIAGLLAVKHAFRETLQRIFPEPHSALVLGLLLGLKRSLPADLREALVLAGVSHIVVISGYNISIITRNLLRTRLVWGRKVAFWLSTLAVLAFVVLTGAEASVIRAAVMGLLLVLALNTDRLYQPVNALVLAAAAMIALNPRILHFDIGFQLSFLATVGLIYLSPIFEKWLKKIPDILGFRTNLASTLAAQIFTLPVLIFYFDRVSLVAPLVNVLILWVIPYVMLLAFVAGLGGMAFLPVGLLAAALPWVLLEYLIRTVEFFARLPFASVFSQITLPMMAVFYLLLFLGLWIYRHKKQFHYYLEYVPVKI